ncbi:type VII secretion-associated serine protease mycosin [Streptomyces sp. A3M-1-3]|uniref:type VII secretion-associated serine protease mycosin n=1 Tax=Streptomyces sp. A3M-1-3 TaxID=2962044 RepID=UPI0020B8CD1D|nr:type VII secretion-associated serine protease mycosin [Streptomyces sp. A3M-1-3]MCP3822475.1 type VII secretion-associated serine protease mycosin [Streptomyces sp. A3M-1-3]
MPTSSIRSGRRRAVVSAALGLLLVGIAATPAYADSVRSDQWYLDAMKAEEIWKISTGKGVTVAVIDSGVEATNPDLRGQVLQGMDQAEGQPGDERTDYSGHGTGMAGLIAGTGQRGGGDGAFGLAPGVKILPIRVRKVGAVNGAQSAEELNTAIRYAADNGAKVINISMGGPGASQSLTDAAKYALEKGSLIFAAVGNDGETTNEVIYPSATPGVVGVGAIGKDLRKTEVSQYGPQVDISAPGEEMVHACKSETGLCKTSGSSDATAIASAAAALIWSKHPNWTNNQVLRVMLNTISAPSDGVKRNDYIGYGAVRPLRALKTPGDPGPADEYPLPDLAADAPKSPSPEASKSKDGTEKDDKPATAASSSSDDSNTGVWIAIGVGAAALIGAAVAVPAVRSRRRNTALPAAPTPHHQHPAYGPPPTSQDPNRAYPPAPPGTGHAG